MRLGHGTLPHLCPSPDLIISFNSLPRTLMFVILTNFTKQNY